MPYIKNSHCHYCGSPFNPDEKFPRQCSNCSQFIYLNPIPVSVILLPVDNGLLVIRRGIEPEKGKLALPGGFMELNENWQEAGAREMFEETEIVISPSELKLFQLISVPGLLLVFAIAEKTEEKKLPVFKENHEITERIVITKPQKLAFEAHTKVVEDYFRMIK